MPCRAALSATAVAAAHSSSSNPRARYAACTTLLCSAVGRTYSTVDSEGTLLIRSTASDLRQEFAFAEHRHAQRIGLVALAAGIGAGDDEAGLFADAARGLTAELLDQLLDFLSLEFF